MIENVQVNQKCQNYQGHSKADSKLGVLGQKKKDKNIEISNNAGSWTSTLNHEKIGGSVEKKFLSRNARITRAFTEGGNESLRLEKELGLFKTKEKKLIEQLGKVKSGISKN